MRVAARSKGKRNQVAQVASIAAPIGGWNARDALGAMEPTDAVILENWFPATTDVTLRRGYSNFATGLPGAVESLLDYSSATTTELWAVSGGSIYDASAAGAVGAAAVSGLANSRFQHINVTTAGGSYLLAVNGADKMRYYNGTAWDYDGAAALTVTGVNTANCVQIALHKNRVWLVEKDSLSVWYLGTSAIAGAANELNFESIAREGGYLMAMGTWTIDAGYGVDDHAVFVTSNGEVIVYKGTDPSDATKWALVGVWRLGSPVGRRCLIKYAGDVLLICQDGVVPLSGALQSSRVNPRVALTDKIQYAVSTAVTSWGANFGWQLQVFPKSNQLYLNVPVAVGSEEQYVMNTITKSWCKFTGWHANCWVLYNDHIYFGGDTVVCKAWDGNGDNDTNINADGLQAFNYFGNASQLKKFGMARPILKASGSPAVLANLNIDFDTDDTTTPLNFAGVSYGVWDTALWDTALWSGDLENLIAWQTVTGIGYSAGMRIKTASKALEVKWVSTDITMERGGVI